jgi:hypothetical protein
LVGACSPLSEELEYNVVAFNYGEHGVVLKNFPVSNALGETSNEWRINPGIPGAWDDSAYFGTFVNYPDSLPKSIKLTWQLADLSNCAIVRSSESLLENDDDPKTYTRKLSCDWAPIEGQVFTRKLDMDAIRNSEAYKKAGTWVEGMPFRDYYLVITLAFRDDQLIVETSNSYRTGV